MNGNIWFYKITWLWFSASNPIHDQEKERKFILLTARNGTGSQAEVFSQPEDLHLGGASGCGGSGFAAALQRQAVMYALNV